MSDRPSLLHCTLSFAKVVIAGMTASVLVVGMYSEAWAVDLLGAQGGGGGASAAAAVAQAAAQAQSQAAQQAAQHSIDMLGRTTQAIQNMRAAQDAARALAAQVPTNIPNGLTPGGLVVDPRVGAANDASNLWVNAKLPTQTSGSDGKVTVTIEQQAQRALLTWQEFNVGRDTTVYFDQRAGNSKTGNNWIALNRIDATGVPSQILGQIKAEGAVVLINPNGVIFNGTSQINVHSLIAAAMDMNGFTGTANGAFKASGDAYVPIIVGGVAQSAVLAPSDEANANKTFLANGLFINSPFQTLVNGNTVSTGATAVFSAGSVPGQTNAGILVEAGARIVTDVSGSDNGGFVALLGPQVTNAGSIETKAGSIIVAAGASALIAEPAPNSTQTAYAVRTNGNGFPRSLVYSPPAATEVARAVNSGLLVSSRGNITLIGGAVEQQGIAEATTSITRAGSITLVASNEAVFGASSLTSVLPEHNGETIPSDAASLANFIAPRVDVWAPYVDFKGGSLVYAPSATMAVTGPETGNNPDGSPPLPSGRVLMEAGSIIDLSGLTASRSVADYIYTFKVTSNDVADTPLAKSLIGETVTIDLSLTGTRADGETWVGSPLFASSGAGYLANVSQGIDQLLTKGGTLSFATRTGNVVTAAFTDVLQAPGAVVNVSGGTVRYAGAAIDTTQLVGSDGRVYDIGKADPFIGYQGFAGTYTVNHSHWGQKDVYANHLYSGSYYKAGYTNGLSAGGLNVTAVKPIIEGNLVGDIVIGAQQRQLAQVATGANGAQLTPDQLPNGPSLSIGLVPYGGRTAVILDNTAPDYIGSDTTLTSPLALPTTAYDDTVAVLTLSTDRLSGYKLGTLTINDNDMLSMTADAHLSLRDGGSVKLGSVATIDGTITAHGGSITISGLKSIKGVELPTSELTSLVIGATALLDVSGRWINDTGHYGDDYAGALYINGGSVSLTSYALSWVRAYDPGTQAVTAEDRSASILLQKGSVIDVSSGGYVGPSGKLALGSDGLAKGKGGNLSLLTYASGFGGRTHILPQYAQGIEGSFGSYGPQTATHGNVVMDGTIYAGGLSQGSTFTLQAPEIVIDGEATQVASITSGDQAGMVVLPTSFFTDSGFGAYKLTSTYGSTTVTAGTTLTLKQQNYLASSIASLPSTGARVHDFASLGYAADGMRHAVDLALTQRSYSAGVDGDRSATAKVLIDEGASILADSQAKITLTGGGPAVILGSITAHGGSITVQGGSIPMIQAPTESLPHDGLPPYVWIGENAVLDVSGTFVPNPLVTAYDTGTVLPGGSISLSSSGGVVVGLQGSLFDISGASGTVEVPTAAGIVGPQIETRQVWSNGGTLTASGYLGGTIRAAGGAPQAAGGTLNVGGEVIVSQSGDVAADFAAAGLPATRAQLGSLVPTLLVPFGTTPSFITADTINSANSGLDTVSFSGPLYFSGDVDLKVAGSTLIDVGRNALTLLPAGVTDRSFTATCPSSGACIPSIGATNVTLKAGYIRFANSAAVQANSLNLPTLADGTLKLEADEQIDLVGVLAVNNASTVNLVSGGDIRLIGTYNFGALVATDNGGATAVSDGYGGMPYAGGLLVADNLNLTARTIYPATDTAYLLMSQGLAPADAAGTHNTITIASNGKAPVAPLSAGGAIVVDAKTIVQGGALYAPLGTIQLGLGAGQTLPSIFVNGPTNNPYNPVQTLANFLGLYGDLITSVSTDSVTLLPGSTTSVSANGLMIPYGATTDGTDWTSNNTLLNGPPTKLIALGGGKVDTQAGAIIEGRGGGDVYATEFVPGTGGSRNVLTTSTQTVYALVPGYGSGLAPYDPGFTTTVAAGTTVTLPGGNGIAAGTYTLLPAEYATLPGAYRVVVASTSANPFAQTFTTADGSVYITGVLGNAINGSSSSQTALLQIQSNSVWTKYSQIDIAKGSTYFAALATTNGTTMPRLAQDAARLVVAASTSLALDADNRFDPAAGGLGGQLDITGTNLVVAASDLRQGLLSSGDYSGYLVLDADMLSGLGIESTLIGGYRSNTSEGTLITATALNLEIATDAEHPLTGPELLFTSLAPTTADPSVRGLVVDDGSVILASGTVSGTDRSALVIGVDPVATKNNQTGAIMWWSAGVSGDGSLLRVSNAGMVDVIRHFVPGVYQTPATTPAPTPPESSVALGNLAIGNNVTLSGKSLTLDSSGATSLAPSASLIAKNYDLAGGIINLGSGTGGLVITGDFIGQLAGADSVRLRSASVFNLYGDNSFGDGSNRIGTLTFDGAGLTSDGGTTAITAGNIVLANSQTTANTNGANTSGSGGTLSLDASGALTFGKGTKTVSGFTSVTAAAATKVLFTGKGSLDAKDANVTLTAPLVLADKAALQSLKTTGLLNLAQGAGTVPAIDPTVIGGSLSFIGGTIDASGTLIAQGSKLTLEAMTGDLTLSGNARLSAAGTRIAIGDLIKDTPAGSIRLYADAGNVTLGSGTTVDVSGAGSGYAGSLAVYANKTATLGATLKGGARYSDLGGTFALIADRLVGGMPLDAGFTRSFQVSLGHGDIAIGAGQTLKSENVLLVANTGGVTVDGTIDASSASGGTIGLYGAGTSTAAAGTAGASGVTIGANAKLYARYQAPNKDSPGYGGGTAKNVQRGGTITLGTTGTPDGTLDPTYGYQNVSGSGAITVASGATFDVSGGPGGDSIDNMGGSVIVRAPILADRDINVSFNGTVVTNAKADGTGSGSPLVANAFSVWSTTDNSTDPDKHFDGIIDPAGFFDQDGNQLISADDSGLYPTSTAESPAAGAYTPHVNFYQKTLLDFVNNPFDVTAVAARFTGAKLKVGANAEAPLPASALHLEPEIDLVNPTTSINSGNVTVASNWNFGAGSLDDNGNVNLLYRTTDGGEPGTLTLRAANNVKINATITDGFFASNGDIATPVNQIANNPAYGADGVAYYNTTSSANLMTAAVSGKGSFSYDFVGGAEFNADGTSPVNPNAVVQLASLNDTVTGNVTVDGHTSYINPLLSDYYRLVVNVPTLVRTGTGSITIAAAGDFALVDQVSPGAVYTAGYVANNADGFTAPTLGPSTLSSGLLTTPVWATGGGDITVTAGRDIVGYETPVDPTGSQFSEYDPNTAIGVSTGQFWNAWYYVNGKSTGSATAPFDASAGGEQYSSWINYGTFFQGFGALGGGNITLKAGRNVQDVSASLPETIQVSGGQSAGDPAVAHYYGGGNLLIEAGNDVLSGVYYVGRGTGLIRAGGEATAHAMLQETDYTLDGTPTVYPYNDQFGDYRATPVFSIPLLLAVQDSQIGVQAAGDITLGGIFEPTVLPADFTSNIPPFTFTQGDAAQTLTAHIGAVFDSYGANSGVSLLSSTGSISVGANASNTLFIHTKEGYGFLAGAASAGDAGAPANLSVTALTGGISIPKGTSLYPSASSDLSLVAGGSIDVGTTLGGTPFGVTMSDGNTVLGSPAAALTTPLHAGDDVPVIIYAGEDITGGNYTLLKQARMWAGRDIRDVTFTGMNTSDDDVTSIIAGRDILASLRPSTLGEWRQARRSLFTLYGPGDFVIEAGRNLGPFSTYAAASVAAYPGFYGGGIFAVGNGANYNTSGLSSLVKSYLPQEGADIMLRYGVGSGIDYAGAIAKYGDAATAAASGIDIVAGFVPALELAVEQLIVSRAKASGIQNPTVHVTLSPSEAADLYTSLTTLAINGKLSELAEKSGLSGLDFNLRPSDFLALIQVKEAIKVQIDRNFLGLLARVGLDYKEPSSPYYGQYARAYDAIATLYPASLGYTDNSSGGSGVAPEIKHTGDLRMARTLVETQTGGDIDILGPGGNLYVGSNSADTLTPAQQGILTMQGGAVRTYTDGSVLIYQSRIFTEQGGNVEMFSANGDLNAGKGPKSAASYPPLRLICDANGHCRVNPAGLVTGAGIGALLSVPGQDPTKSNVILSAPRGVIDFGAAGVRTAGDLAIIAPVVLNAFNAQVGGTATGVPTFLAPDVGGMTQASNTSAGAVSGAAAAPGQQGPSEQPSVIIVEVIGYGGGDSEPDSSSVETSKQMQQRQNEPTDSSSEDEEERKRKKKQMQQQ